MANISKINFKGVEYDIKPLMDAAPTHGSSNAVSSGGVYDVIANVGDKIQLCVSDKLIYSGNVVDTRGKTAPSSSLDSTIHFNFVDGKTHYSNPFTTDSGKTLLLYPRDENGNAIYLNRVGSSNRSSLFDLNKWYLWVIKVEGLNVTVKGYQDQSKFESDSPSNDYTYTLESTPAYWQFRGAGYTAGDAVDRGFTVDEYSTSYVPYTEPSKIPDYAEALDEHIQGFIAPIANNVTEHTDLIKKTAEVLHVHSGNVVDTTDIVAPGNTLGSDITFLFDNDVYYTNPFTTDSGKNIMLYPKDKNGNTIYLVHNGSRTSYVELSSAYLYKLTVNDLIIDVYGYRTMAQFLSDTRTIYIEYALESEPAYWVFGGRGYTAGEAINRGFTQRVYNTEYVAYSEPIKTYVYTDGLNNHITEYTDGVRNDVYEPSMNLLDYSKIIWHPDSGVYKLENGYYMPVVEGTTIVTNNTQGRFHFFDSLYSAVGSEDFSIPYKPITVPSGAVWARVSYDISYISEGDNVMVWQARTAESAPYERPIFRPSIQFDPQYANGEMFNYAIPTGLNQGVMRWARFVAIRAMNESRDTYRFGTFNTYVSRGKRGFPVIREMLFNYGIDFCGFQECEYAGTAIGSAVYDFQFPYNSGAKYETDAVPAVSRFEVTSVNTVALRDGNHYCKIVKMNLPQNKHYPRVPTLSVYNYHGSLALSNRLAEIQDMLAIIANDTSDFIVIMGDTNSEVDSTGHRQSWDAWEAAGFTAVHHGESPTWPSVENPSRYSSMDNIFVSEHINVLHYDIINGLSLMLEDGSATLSDHDFVFADLQFDFDAVLKDTWTES